MTVYRSILPFVLLAVGAGAAIGSEPMLEAATPGDRLDISNYAGTIRVGTWDDDRIRITAERRAGEEILVTHTGSVIRVRAKSWDEASDSLAIYDDERAVLRLDGKLLPGVVDYDVTVPAWMAVSVGGAQSDVLLEDLSAPAEIKIFQGTVQVRRQRGDLSVRSLAGELRVEEMTGILKVRGWQGSVTARDTDGDLTIETTSGNISVTGHAGGAVEVVTVAGSISYEGGLPSGNRVSLATHSGDIGLVLPERTDAAVTVRTLRGSFESDFVEDVPDGKSVRFRIGSGRDILDVESFGGRIRVDRGD